jgi:sodium transport system permease protein
MLPPKVRAVYIKELRDSIRDRRVVFASIIVPLMIYPVMMLGLAEVLISTQDRMSRETYTIAIPKGSTPFFDKLVDDYTHGEKLEDITGLGENADPMAAMKAAQAAKTELAGKPSKVITIPLKFSELESAEADKKLASGEVQAIVEVPNGFEEKVKNSEEASVDVRIDKAEHRSRDASARIFALFERYQKRAILERLKAHNMTAPEMHPFVFKTTNVADAAKVGGSIFSFLPMLFIVMIIMGAMYPAIDMTAGEKERSTLETLIVTPVRPIEIIAGKFLAVTTLAIGTAALNVASCGGSFLMMPLPQLSELGVPWSALPLALLLLIPLTFFFAAALLAVASFASNHKEAGIYCMPVFMIPLIGMVMVVLPDVELDGPLLLAPVVNVALMIKELFLRHGTAQQVVFVFVSTCLYAAGMVALAGRVFAREEVLFNAQGSIRLFLSRRFFKRSERPRPGDALLVAAILFPLNFYFQSWLQKALLDITDIKVANFALVVAIPLYFIFFALPIGIAWYLKLDLKKTFQWNMPSYRALFGAVCLGCSSFFIAQQLQSWQSLFWHFSSADMDMLNKPIEAMSRTGWGMTLLIFLIGVSPGICEEHFFRGFLQQGVLGRNNKWSALLLVGFIFGAFHFPLFRQPIVMLMGVALAYVAYESKSIWPGVCFHFLHNSLSLFLPAWTGMNKIVTQPGEPLPNVPLQWLIPALALFSIGLVLVRGARRPIQHPVLEGMATAAGS